MPGLIDKDKLDKILQEIAKIAEGEKLNGLELKLVLQIMLANLDTFSDMSTRMVLSDVLERNKPRIGVS